MQGFLDFENETVSNVDVSDTVIATGGSVVYGEKAMQHLKKEWYCHISQTQI